MSKPYISIIVTAHSRTQFIYEALSSILNQTIDRNLYEIIVVSNFYLDSNYVSEHDIKLIHVCEESLGLKVALAVEQSRGDVISFLEDDDLWESDKLSSIYKLFISDPLLCYVHNHMSVINEKGKTKDNYFISGGMNQIEKNGKFIIKAGKARYRKIRLATYLRLEFYASSISVRGSVIKSRLNLLKKLTRSTDVFYFYCSLLSDGTLIGLPCRLTNYRVHYNNVSLGSTDANAYFENKFEFNEACITDYNTIFEMAKSHRNYAVIRAVKCRTLETKMQSIWFSCHTNRLKLLLMTFVYLRYISSSTLNHDLTIIAFNALFVFSPKRARSLFLKRYFQTAA